MIENKDSWPVWQCHKRVRARKILCASVIPDNDGCIDTVVLDSGETIKLTEDVGRRFKNMSGSDTGYMVIYEDGYISWSPSKAFEEGYHHADKPHEDER